MQTNKKTGFSAVAYALPPALAFTLKSVPEEIQNKTEEIRLRRGNPVTLTVGGRVCFVDAGGSVLGSKPHNPLVCTAADLNECFSLLCNHSLFSRGTEIKQGYISMQNGCRAGIAGNFSGENVTRLYSINIRIARQLTGVADFLISQYCSGGVLIAGPPASGKTTLLRDLIRGLSQGDNGKYYRIALIDERGELASAAAEGGFEIGVNTDILSGVSKEQGIQMALRSLSPDIVAFDELGTVEEVQAVAASLNAGVDILTTVHIGKREDLLHRSVIKSLLSTGAVGTIVVLPPDYKQEKQVYTLQEVLSWDTKLKLSASF